MIVHDLGKLVLLGIGLVGGLAMVLLGRSPETGAGLCIYILGYLTGNGVLAKSGKAPSPALVVSQDRLDEMTG